MFNFILFYTKPIHMLFIFSYLLGMHETINNKNTIHYDRVIKLNNNQNKQTH